MRILAYGVMGMRPEYPCPRPIAQAILLNFIDAGNQTVLSSNLPRPTTYSIIPTCIVAPALNPEPPQPPLSTVLNDCLPPVPPPPHPHLSRARQRSAQLTAGPPSAVEEPPAAPARRPVQGLPQHCLEAGGVAGGEDLDGVYSRHG